MCKSKRIIISILTAFAFSFVIGINSNAEEVSDNVADTTKLVQGDAASDTQNNEVTNFRISDVSDAEMKSAVSQNTTDISDDKQEKTDYDVSNEDVKIPSYVYENNKVQDSLEEFATKNNEELFYKPESYLVADQKTAILTLSTNDKTSISKVIYRVWTGNGKDMREYATYLQPDGRYMAFVGVNDFGKVGTYNCLATVVFKDGHEENAGFVFFEISPISLGSVQMTNINGTAGTFDIILSNIDSISGVDYIDVIAFTRQDLSDAHVYRAYKRGNEYVVNANVSNHGYNYGAYGVSATVYAGNGVSAEKSYCNSIDKPVTALSTFTADNKNYFMIAENTPYGASTVGVNFYVWNQGASDLRMYRGFRDGNRWLAILPITDYMKGGTFSYIARAQVSTGGEIDLNGSSFNVVATHVDSTYVMNPNSSNGCFDVVITGISGLNGVTGLRTIVLTRPDFSDAFQYGYIDCGNNTFLFKVDVANHQFNYGTYTIAVYVRNGIGIEEMSYATCFNLAHPNSLAVALPINDEADVTLGAWDLPYQSHIYGMQFFVWNSGNDMRCYSTINKNYDGSYSLAFSMNDFGKMGMFYVLPRIVRDNWTTEDLGLISFNITKINMNYGIMGTSGTNVYQMVRFFESRADYPYFYTLYSDAPSIYDMCQIYYEECAAEGVRAEVAFCQAMLETGWLRFGGAVDIAAYNFAGIGAVDSSPDRFNWFPNVRTGVRAQVQHLKAYASTLPLNQECVDPRFYLVDRGCAPFVESLGNGKWASSAAYGTNIRNLINALFWS